MQRKQGLSYYLAGYLVALFCVGCHTGPSFRDDTAYRAIERESDRNSAGLAVTGAGIAAGVERVDGHAERVQTSLENLTTMIDNSGLEDAEKSALLRRVAVAQEETAALRGEVGILREDTGRLNAQLAEQREISAALSAEHDKREATASAVRIELEATKEKLAKVKGQRNLYLVILIAVCTGILGYAAFRVLRFLRVIPV